MVGLGLDSVTPSVLPVVIKCCPYAAIMPVVTGEHVTTGTGIVHTTITGRLSCWPSLRFANAQAYRWTRRLYYHQSLMNLHVFKANLLLSTLHNNGALLHEQPYNTATHCWRHKTPLFFSHTTVVHQHGFVGLRQQMRTAISETHWTAGTSAHHHGWVSHLCVTMVLSHYMHQRT